MGRRKSQTAARSGLGPPGRGVLEFAGHAFGAECFGAGDAVGVEHEGGGPAGGEVRDAAEWVAGPNPRTRNRNGHRVGITDLVIRLDRSLLLVFD